MWNAQALPVRSRFAAERFLSKNLLFHANAICRFTENRSLTKALLVFFIIPHFLRICNLFDKFDTPPKKWVFYNAPPPAWMKIRLFLEKLPSKLKRKEQTTFQTVNIGKFHNADKSARGGTRQILYIVEWSQYTNQNPGIGADMIISYGRLVYKKLCWFFMQL